MSEALTNQYLFISDPSHGWLRATKRECERLGVVPSIYSYQDRMYYYLEEDCDAALFVEAKKAAGESFSVREEYQDNTNIRYMIGCKGE